MIQGNELFFMPAYQLRQLLLKKEISCVELTEAFLGRIERLNPKLNVYLGCVAI